MHAVSRAMDQYFSFIFLEVYNALFRHRNEVLTLFAIKDNDLFEKALENMFLCFVLVVSEDAMLI